MSTRDTLAGRADATVRDIVDSIYWPSVAALHVLDTIVCWHTQALYSAHPAETAHLRGVLEWWEATGADVSGTALDCSCNIRFSSIFPRTLRPRVPEGD